MLININKNRKLELVGEMENDENKEYFLLVKVSPTGLEAPSSQMEEAVQKVGVSDAIARVVPREFVDQYFKSQQMIES